jgi:hypothetical protein
LTVEKGAEQANERTKTQSETYPMTRHFFEPLSVADREKEKPSPSPLKLGGLGLQTALINWRLP